ncbi:Endo-1,4-beta-xylanase A precursor [compost metagenome]
MAEVSDYARDSVVELSKMGLIHGDGHGIHPKNLTTRAESAVLIYNIYYLDGD